MNTDTNNSNINVSNNNNIGNMQWAQSNGPRCGQTCDSDPFVAHRPSIDLSDAGDDESVLDCSDWDNVCESVTRSHDVGLSTDQLHHGGIDFTSPMSPSTHEGVDGSINPKRAGTTAGKSVTPTVWRNQMQKLEFLSAWDVLAGPRHVAFVNAVTPVNGHSLSDVDGQVLKYVHSNDQITWWGVLLDSSHVDNLEDLGKSLRSGGVDELAALRFPCRFAWVGADEALDFWQQILPVKPSRIMFTSLDMYSVYVQLTSGHILHLILDWDDEGVADETLINSIFMQIIESKQVGK